MRGLLRALCVCCIAASAAVCVAEADARMTALFDVTDSVNALTDPVRPEALAPGVDGLYQQSVARRGDEFPVASDDPANPRDGQRFVAKVLGRSPAAPPGNCSNTYLAAVDGSPLGADAIADLLRDGTGRVEAAGCVDNTPPAPDQSGIDTFTSRMVFVEEIGGEPWRSTSPEPLAAPFRQALEQLSTELAPGDVPSAPDYEPPPTMAERVHAYLRLPQTLVAFPETWVDVRATLPLLGGTWLELYGYDGDSTVAWDEARYATWIRPFAQGFAAAGGDLRRLHLLMGASVRSAAKDPGRGVGDQWKWARAGAACELLRSGPGAYRVGAGNPSDPWGEFGQGFRETFSDATGQVIPAGAPPDLAPTSIVCAPAYRLTNQTNPRAAEFATAVARLGRGAMELPNDAIEAMPNGELRINIAAGLPDWLDAGFAGRAGGVVTATSDGSITTVPVDPDGVARVNLPGADPGAVKLTLSGIRAPALLEAARGENGRLPDPHLSLLCPGARLPGESLAEECVNVIAPETGRAWMPADGAYDWLLGSTTLTAPITTLTVAPAAGSGGASPASPPSSTPGPPSSSNGASRGQLAQLTPPEGGGACAPAPDAPAPAPESARGRFTLSARQFLINQRIYQAAIRRANAVEAWLSEGIVARDLCGGALPVNRFVDSVGFVAADGEKLAANPRPFEVAPPGRRGDGVTVSRRQALINQRLAQAAIRRANALHARIDGQLTGGDLRDRQLTTGQLVAGLGFEEPGAAPSLPASKTRVQGRRGGDPSAVTLTVAQLGINQRIGQQAVRRVNSVVADLESGLVAQNFRAGSIGGNKVAGS